MVKRITKKACSSPGEHLTQEFIQKAIKLYPIELLENPELKLLYDFSSFSSPFFSIYYSKNLKNHKSLLDKILNPLGKDDIEICSLVFALHPQNSEAARFIYAMNIIDKGLVKTFTRYYPEYKDWNFLLDSAAKFFGSKVTDESCKVDVLQEIDKAIYSYFGVPNLDDFGTIVSFYERVESNKKIVFEKIKEFISDIIYVSPPEKIQSNKGLNLWWSSFLDYKNFIWEYSKLIFESEPLEEIEFFWKFLFVGIKHHGSKYTAWFFTNFIWEKSLKDPQTFIIIVNKIEKKIQQTQENFQYLDGLFLQSKRGIIINALFQNIISLSSDKNMAEKYLQDKSTISNWMPKTWENNIRQKLKKTLRLRESQMVKRITKKACQSLETDFTDEIIKKALKLYPLELMKNPRLKMEYLFRNGRPKYYDIFYIEYDLMQIKQMLIEFTKEYKDPEFDLSVLLICLREDIPVAHRFFFALYLNEKSNIKTLSRYYPEFLDLGYLLSMCSQQNFLSTYRYLLQLKPWRNNRACPTMFSLVLNFYIKATGGGGEVYTALKHVVKNIDSEGNYEGFLLNLADLEQYKTVLRLCSNHIKNNGTNEEDQEILPLIVSVLSSYSIRWEIGYRWFISNFIFNYCDKDYDKLLSFLVTLEKVTCELSQLKCNQGFKNGMREIFPLTFFRNRKRIGIEGAIKKYILNNCETFKIAEKQLLYPLASYPIDPIFNWYPYDRRLELVKELEPVYKQRENN